MFFGWRVLRLSASPVGSSEHFTSLLRKGMILKRSSSYVVLGEGKNVSKERHFLNDDIRTHELIYVACRMLYCIVFLYFIHIHFIRLYCVFIFIFIYV